MDTKWGSVLSKNFIRIRKNNRYSQNDISEVLQISQPSYNRIESGKIQINVLGLYRLAEFYNVLIDDFFSLDINSGQHTDVHELKKEVLQLQDKIKTLEMINEFIEKRNVELEEKLTRKNRKIDSLLNRKRVLMQAFAI